MFKWLPVSTLKEYSGMIPNNTIFVYDFDTDKETFDLIDVIEPDRQKTIVEQNQKEQKKARIENEAKG